MLRAGLTGNIGSGKTIVARIFSLLGVPVFHADQEAKALYASTEVKARLSDILGMGIFNEQGDVDRKKMAALLFSDAERVKKVNALIHPLVREALAEFAARHSSHPYLIYEAAILVESGYYQQLDRLILVSAPEELRVERVAERDQVSREEVMRRAGFQLPEEQKVALADWVIFNDGSRLVIPQVLETDRQLRLHARR